MHRLLRRLPVFLIILSAFFLIAGFWPWIRIAYLNMTTDRYILPIHNSKDYWTYTAIIRQGLEGYRSVYNMFVSQPQTGTYTFVFYLFLGMIGRVLGIVNPDTVYHAARLLLGILWMAVIYRFCIYVTRTKEEGRLAYVFTIVSGSFPKLIPVPTGGYGIGTYFGWWTEMSPVKRSTFLPHYLIGHTLLVLMSLCIFRFEKTGKLRYLFTVMTLGIMTGFIHTPSLIILMIIIPLYALLRRKPVLIISAIAYCLVSLIGLLAIDRIYSLSPVWIDGKAYEALSFAVSIPDFLLALGPVVLLALGGVIAARKHIYTPFLMLWVVMSVVMLYIAWWIKGVPQLYWFVHRFPVSNVRFLQTALWVPLAVLGSYAVTAVYKRFGRAAYAGILGVFFILTFITFPPEVKDADSGKIDTVSLFGAPDESFFSALSSLTTHRDDGVVISNMYVSDILPTYSGRRAFPGKAYTTSSFELFAGHAYRFFRAMTDCEAYRLVRDNHISHVFYGFDEQAAGDRVYSYPFLSKPKEYGDTKIFSVIPWEGSTSCKL